MDGIEPEPDRAALISAMAAQAAALHRSGTPLYTLSGSYVVRGKYRLVTIFGALPYSESSPSALFDLAPMSID